MIKVLREAVCKNLYKRAETANRGVRQYLRPLVTEKMLKQSNILTDKDVIDHVSKMSDPKAFVFSSKYAYFDFLSSMLGKQLDYDATLDEDDSESTDLDDESEVTEESEAESNTKSKKSTKKPLYDFGSHSEMRQCWLDNQVKYDWMCEYILHGNDESDRKLQEIIDEYGLVQTLDYIGNMKTDHKSNSSNVSLTKIRTMAMIRFSLRDLTYGDALSILSKFDKDKLPKQLARIKNLDDILNIDKIGVYREFIVGELLTKVSRGMRPDDVTDFFRALDSGKYLFDNFKLTDEVKDLIKKHKYLSYEAYINNVLYFARLNFTEDDLKRQYQFYATPEYLQQREMDKKVAAFIYQAHRSADANALYETYTGLLDKRYIHVGKDSIEVEDFKARVKEVQDTYERYNGCSLFYMTYNDFVDADIKSDIYYEFLDEIIERAKETDGKQFKLIIAQSDKVTLGGMTLTDTSDPLRLNVSLWILPHLKYVRAGKEAIWIVAHNLHKNGNNSYAKLQFNVNKNNKDMINLLNSLGAVQTVDYSDETNIGTFEVDIDELGSKRIQDIR